MPISVLWDLLRKKDFQYNLLFFIFVICDVITTTLFMDMKGIRELNPIVSYIYNMSGIGIGFIIFWIVKHISLEVIWHIFNYQNNKINNIGYVTYFIILIMSLYVVTNNIYLILTI